MIQRLVLLFVLLCLEYVALSEWKEPSVFIAILARNKAHTLPYFLTTLEKLNYPKDRISLWVRSDHNSDKTIEILKKWIEAVKDQYHMISTDFVIGEESYPDERGPAHWTKERFNHVIALRESALNFARYIWADYFLSFWNLYCCRHMPVFSGASVVEQPVDTETCPVTKALNSSILQEISPLPGYVDPYHKRPMTLGEIGCFLSHYNIWKDIVRKGYETTLVLEDDIRFEPFFRSKVLNVMSEVKRISGWDLVYFGRKRLQENDEPWVEGSSLLVEAGYSYWTLGYVLSLGGAKKLLNAEPLSRLVPVDEYLPILFDKHPQTTWKGHFPQRNLVALSAAPLLVYPTHYTGEQGYISDTEDSVAIKDTVPSARDDL